MSDILSRIQNVLNEQKEELINRKADKLNLKKTGWGYHIDEKGNSFTWNEKIKNFNPGIKVIDHTFEPEKVHYHFIKKYGMKKIDDEKLSDEHGNHWKIDHGARKLIKVFDAKDLEDPKKSGSKTKPTAKKKKK